MQESLWLSREAGGSNRQPTLRHQQVDSEAARASGQGSGGAWSRLRTGEEGDPAGDGQGERGLS